MGELLSSFSLSVFHFGFNGRNVFGKQDAGELLDTFVKVDRQVCEAAARFTGCPDEETLKVRIFGGGFSWRHVLNNSGVHICTE